MKKYTILICCTLVIIASFYFAINHKSGFSPDKWNSQIWERRQMIDDLTTSYDLSHMTYEDIINLLGTNGIDESTHAEGVYIAYFVDKGIADPVLFYISFGKDLIVSNYGLING